LDLVCWDTDHFQGCWPRVTLVDFGEWRVAQVTRQSVYEAQEAYSVWSLGNKTEAFVIFDRVCKLIRSSGEYTE